MLNPKYKLGERHLEENLYRVVALCDFGNVKAGDIGGWVESESNLSQEGDCWVYDESEVRTNARVYGSARVSESAKVAGDAQVYGYARVYDSAEVSGSSLVYDDAKVYGSAKVYDNAIILQCAKVYGQAHVYGTSRTGGRAQVYGFAKVYGNADIYGTCKIYGEAKVEGAEVAYGDVTDYATLRQKRVTRNGYTMQESPALPAAPSVYPSVVAPLNSPPAEKPICCPCCGSSQITAFQKGFSGMKALGGALLVGPLGLLAGTIGRGDIVLSCMKCGHKFRPRGA